MPCKKGRSAGLFRVGKGWRLCPFFALLDSRAGRIVSVFGVERIPGQQIAGDLRALAAVQKALFLAAHGHGALPVKGVPVRGDTPFAMAAFCKRTAAAAQAASCVDHLHRLPKNGFCPQRFGAPAGKEKKSRFKRLFFYPKRDQAYKPSSVKNSNLSRPSVAGRFKPPGRDPPGRR